ncbi:MAG: hypothetical protein CME64_01625 [Halobacteriovoraceae bacterium]|nr:hypothetical protein [Halobacteriovoraceae bacterium]|tara:strand:+ start:96577 stop:97512 length:936 start_codon:yes stop_codon:yes gene_type:complete
MEKYGQVLKIFVMGGEFEGLQAIELSNWSGKAFLGHKNHSSFCTKRDELQKTGIYILSSSDQTEDGVFQVYIGETDAFAKRICAHERKKSWWDKFIVFTAGDDNLTKAHVRYLERQLYQLAQNSGAPVEIMNSSEPGGANLSEAELCFTSAFLDNILFTLKTLGFDYFREVSPKREEVQEVEKNNLLITGERFYTLQLRDFWLDGKPLKSFMRVESGKFVVEKGSYIRLNPTPSFKNRGGYYKQWIRLVNSEKVLKSEIEGLGVLGEDVAFSSPSASGSVMRAKATNGATRWRSCSSGETLKEVLAKKEVG